VEANAPKFERDVCFGAFEALSTVVVDERVSVAKHYNECVSKAGLTTGQLEENMKEYADTQLDLQHKPVPVALMRYLVSLCGTPATQTPWQAS
jgi:hypothetical protein